MTYSDVQKSVAARWKAHTADLSDESRAPAPYVGKDGADGAVVYDYCLPRRWARHNLLPAVRDEALSLFDELAIPWHAGVDGGPSNHLLSSQVQCVNALLPMVRDPDRIVAAFGDLLGIDTVLPIEPGRYLTFEYIGPTDFFGEGRGGARIRGAHCTSVDAAFRHRARDGRVELVLVEWKYTESYRVRHPDPAKDRIRATRYASAVADPSGPIRSDVLPFPLLLDEPFYQLVRQQLLAHALELSEAEQADRVRVVHVCPSENQSYQRSLARAEHRALGATVSEVWRRLLRAPDRFVAVDSDRFLDPAVTSSGYVLRYAPDVVFDDVDLVADLGVADAAGVEDAIDFDGDIELTVDGPVLIIDGVGTQLSYPFRLRELHALSGELDPG